MTDINIEAKKRCRKIFFGWIIVTLVSTLTFRILTELFFPNKGAQADFSASQENESLPIYDEEKLGKFNGTNSNFPIYIGFEGYVYDVTPGSNYYKPGGPYHYLAGKDSTKELRLIGGDIIKRKYPVVGILSSNTKP